MRPVDRIVPLRPLRSVHVVSTPRRSYRDVPARRRSCGPRRAALLRRLRVPHAHRAARAPCRARRLAVPVVLPDAEPRALPPPPATGDAFAGHARFVRDVRAAVQRTLGSARAPRRATLLVGTA